MTSAIGNLGSTLISGLSELPGTGCCLRRSGMISLHSSGGTALAGFSEGHKPEDWIAPGLRKCSFDALATSELVCNALLHRRGDIIYAVVTARGRIERHPVRCGAG